MFENQATIKKAKQRPRLIGGVDLFYCKNTVSEVDLDKFLGKDKNRAQAYIRCVEHQFF
jgi:hypothetical protein